MRKIILAALLSLVTAACAGSEAPSDNTSKIDVVAAFFPVAEAAERIGGGRVRVTNLTPAGVEPHDLELSTSALDRVLDADVVVYLGGFQPALDEAAEKAGGTAVDLLDGLSLRKRDTEERAFDPHVWLDPQLWARAVARIQDALEEVDPDGASDYRRRGGGYINDLKTLDSSIMKGLSSCESDLIVTSHAAFGYLADRYALRQVSISGVSPEAEPDPEHLAELADLVDEERVTTVFTEELVSPKVAETLAREAGARVDVLDPMESEPEGDYVAGMRNNLGRLQEALRCR